MDIRWAVVVPTLAAIFFVIVGFATDGTTGLRDHYNLLVDNLGLYVVLALMYLVAVLFVYRTLSRRPRKFRAVVVR